MDSQSNLSSVIKCPECGCTKVKELKQYSQHCNKSWNEDKTFECGYTAHFSPNFMQILPPGGHLTEYMSICKESKSYKKDIANKKEFLKKLTQFINEYQPVDDKCKEKVLGDIKYVFR